MMDDEKSGGMAIGVRHLESILRMSESFAKMKLRSHVSNADVDAAINVMVSSFVSAQKISIAGPMRKVLLPLPSFSHFLVLVFFFSFLISVMMMVMIMMVMVMNDGNR